MVEDREVWTATVLFFSIPDLKDLNDGPLIQRVIRGLHATIERYLESLDGYSKNQVQVLSALTGAIMLIHDHSPVRVLDILDDLPARISDEGIPIRMGITHGEVEALEDADSSLNFIGVPINEAARLATSSENQGALAHSALSEQLKSILSPDDWLHENQDTIKIKGKRDELFDCYACPPDEINICSSIDKGKFPKSKPRPKSLNAVFLAYDLPNFSKGDRVQLSSRFRSITASFKSLRAEGKIPKKAELYLAPGGDGGVLVLSNLSKKAGYDLGLRLIEVLAAEGLHKTNLIQVNARVGLHYGMILLYKNAQGVERPVSRDLFIADEIIADDWAKDASKLVVTGAFKEIIGRGSDKLLAEKYSPFPLKKKGLLKGLKRYVERDPKTGNP